MTFDEWYVDTEFNPMIYGALQAAWQAATLAEREECAKVCDEFDSENPHIGQTTAVAAAIRARSNVK